MSPDAVLSSPVQVAAARSPGLLPRQPVAQESCRRGRTRNLLVNAGWKPALRDRQDACPTIVRHAVLLVLCLCTVLTAAQAAEPWTDPKLPLSEGLQLWLDASRQVSFRQQHGPRWLSEGARVDRWFDGSGQHRDVSQLVKDFTPQFRSGGGVGWVRFDGRDDFLSGSQVPLRLTNATVFIVAAPGSNPGDFRGLLAFSEISHNDYTHGLNVDLGPFPGTYFGWLNVEGAGAGGAMNLMGESSPFGRFRVIAVAINSGAGGVTAWIDGKAGGKRDRTASTIFVGETLVGARFYSNNDELPHARGFFEGDIAEILLYDRALDDATRERVTAYLAEKYSGLRAQTDRVANTFNPLVPVVQPPPAQMFVPGFGVRELPLQLPNINCLKYRADGKLVALGYNGHIYLLTDKDGDGLEETVEPFWETNSLRAPIGMALTPPGYSRGQGVFVAAKGKVALIVDTDGDDRADREIIVAEGWSELPHGVDALGVALDKEGNVYFGLGAADFTNAYLVDRETGRAGYALKSERGTIVKVSADFQKREIVCTGIRFSVALAFNRLGDLFCTDQEGATWLPNGNPLDELLHIQPGRHYGFPPRHPKYLPDVVDEPSTFDYAPQHQSTCGLNFNEPVNGGLTFGPAWWAGDALVAGYSRGKLYRTKLVKTPAGYVAQNQLIAAMNMLTVDACVSPRGDVVVATHSGQPDWGSGPNGIGKLFKFRYEQPELPQPVAVWAASPTETRIAWDRPLTAEQARALVKECAMAGGKYLTAGERFESLRPGYQVVQDQLGTPRFVLPVLSTKISTDGRLLMLRTEVRRQAVNYAVTLASPGEAVKDKVGGADHPSERGASLAQHATIDLAYTLNGVEASWKASTPIQSRVGTKNPPLTPPRRGTEWAGTIADSPPGRGRGWVGSWVEEFDTWTGWIPSFDMDVTRALTGASPAHEPWRSLLTSAGSLTLRAQVDLWQMLRPAVQPGAALDYDLPAERVSLRFAAKSAFAVKFGAQVRQSAPGSGGRHELSIEHTPVLGEWLPVELSIPTHTYEPELSVTWHTAEDSRERPLALHRLYLPWASPHQAPAQETPPATPFEVAGANWLNGRRIFFSEKTACYRCHQLRGEGHKVGPDLSSLIHRDYASVRKDILEPNAALNPITSLTSPKPKTASQ